MVAVVEMVAVVVRVVGDVTKAITVESMFILKPSYQLITHMTCNLQPLAMASIRDGHGMTVLHFAAILGNHDAISWLADAFGETLALIRNNHGQGALHFAAAKGIFKKANMLGNDKCISICFLIIWT